MPDHKEAASKRAKMLVALAEERATHVRAGNAERVRQVDAAIESLGGKETARKAPPVGRTSERKSVT